MLVWVKWIVNCTCYNGGISGETLGPGGGRPREARNIETLIVFTPVTNLMDEAHEHQVAMEAIHRFECLKLEPQLVPHDSVSHLRGCLRCINLRGSNIDAALILTRGSYVDEPKRLYRVDYATRGNLKGVPGQREIVYTRLSLEGLLRRRLREVTWSVPQGRVHGSSITAHREAAPPQPGEVWEEGPHHALAERLNGNPALYEELLSHTRGLGEPYMALTLFSDPWGESIRLKGSRWVELEEALSLYMSPAYLRIADGVHGHLREIRRRLGGLTF